MATILANGNKIILQKKLGINEILIDFNDYKSNYSRRRLSPENLNTNNDESILEKYQSIINKMKAESNYISNLLIITLIINNLMRKNTSIKMLELGSNDGRLSRYFAEILKYFNNESRLICIDLFNQVIKKSSFFEENDIFQLYKSNINISNSSDIVKTIISNPIDILEILEDDSFDIIFVNSKFSDDIYINQYVNKIKNNGLFIVDLDNDVNKLDKYNEKCFDNYTNIDNKIILYSNVDKNQKEFLKYESKKYKQKELYQNIFETLKYLIGKIEHIVENTSNKEIIYDIDSIVVIFNNMEELFTQINNDLNNSDLKYETNEVKNSLLDLMFEIKGNGHRVETFKKDLIDNTIIWSDSIENEFC